jgi:Fe2+ transport system protein FeoA
VLRLFARSKKSVARTLPTAPAPVRACDALCRQSCCRDGACVLASCATGSRATVLSLGCSDADACRLRALGLCEGASVSVVDARNCMLLEVRGTRLALGAAITAGITVQPLTS